MHVCIYVCMHSYMYVTMHACMPASMHACMCVLLCIECSTKIRTMRIGMRLSKFFVCKNIYKERECTTDVQDIKWSSSSTSDSVNNDITRTRQDKSSCGDESIVTEVEYSAAAFRRARSDETTEGKIRNHSYLLDAIHQHKSAPGT